MADADPCLERGHCAIRVQQRHRAGGGCGRPLPACRGAGFTGEAARQVPRRLCFSSVVLADTVHIVEAAAMALVKRHAASTAAAARQQHQQVVRPQVKVGEVLAHSLRMLHTRRRIIAARHVHAPRASPLCEGGWARGGRAVATPARVAGPDLQQSACARNGGRGRGCKPAAELRRGWRGQTCSRAHAGETEEEPGNADLQQDAAAGKPNAWRAPDVKEDNVGDRCSEAAVTHNAHDQVDERDDAGANWYGLQGQSAGANWYGLQGQSAGANWYGLQRQSAGANWYSLKGSAHASRHIRHGQLTAGSRSVQASLFAIDGRKRSFCLLPGLPLRTTRLRCLGCHCAQRA
eukprot:364861-Chlamydomonas_euryale.AAC.22